MAILRQMTPPQCLRIKLLFETRLAIYSESGALTTPQFRKVQFF
jgi:hypothetical protein